HYGTLSTILTPGSDELFAWASSITAAKVFDPNIRPSVLADKNLYRDSVEQWLAISDVVKFSSDDMNWLYSLNGSESALVDMAKKILELGPSIIVITLGEDGILGITRDQTLKVPSVPVAVVDTVGAGC
ncbi:MAG: carbohydrate kinase, partial [Actinobacteria bacterium]|nr:carbohydrate kinase [Actinomycetota bacterium]